MRLIIGISGSTGAIYGVRLLETLKWLGIESHLVMSKSAEMTIGYEIEMQTASDGTRFTLWVAGASSNLEANGSQLTVGRWYHLAVSTY